MSAADAIGRAAEVQAAFLEGLRKGWSGLYGTHEPQSDRQAWEHSDARARLAYGVFPPCARCRCQIIKFTGGLPSCGRCGVTRPSPTTQHKARDTDAFEGKRLDEVLARALPRIGDGRDAIPDPRDRTA